MANFYDESTYRTINTVKMQEQQPKEKPEECKLFIVRLWDGFDGVWTDYTDPLLYEEAHKIWLEKTDGGTKHICFDHIDYFKIFPANTRMTFNEHNPMFEALHGLKES